VIRQGQMAITVCIQHGLWYFQNRSLRLDVKILLMTPFVLVHRNAY
jgi:lipopolysaccharide/colanic/teichoic acid biosynthesis glycosyltransferase